MVCFLGFQELFAQRACQCEEQRVVWRRTVIRRLDRKQDSRWTGDTIPE
jgi:hypothetical protein